MIIADKGGGVVIMDFYVIKNFINKAYRQLNNKYHYRTLNKDPTTTNAKLANDKIQRVKKEKLTKEKTADSLKCLTQNCICSQKFIKKNNLVDR